MANLAYKQHESEYQENIDVFDLISQYDEIGFHWMIDSMNQIAFIADEERWDEYDELPRFENAKELRAALIELGRVEPPMPKIDPAELTYKRIEY
jgi:hypothetical protein